MSRSYRSWLEAGRWHRAVKRPRALMRGDTKALARRVEEEAEIFAKRLRSPEAREAFHAFLEKRPPDFRRG